jgi:hypothetical protein
MGEKEKVRCVVRHACLVLSKEGVDEQNLSFSLNFRGCLTIPGQLDLVGLRFGYPPANRRERCSESKHTGSPEEPPAVQLPRLCFNSTAMMFHCYLRERSPVQPSATGSRWVVFGADMTSSRFVKNGHTIGQVHHGGQVAKAGVKSEERRMKRGQRTVDSTREGEGAYVSSGKERADDITAGDRQIQV